MNRKRSELEQILASLWPWLAVAGIGAVHFERIIRSDEISVAELTHGSGVTQSATSQHLHSLKQAGLVADRAQGRNVFYRTP